jgi:hypothetical protein
MRTRKSQIEYNQEIIDFIEYNKNQPIWESKGEKKEYIRNELNELAMSENGWDKIRYKILLKSV